MLNTKDRNDFSFDIIKLLNDTYAQTKSILIGVYFHELLKYACSYYLCKNSEIYYKDNIIFPFINSDYVKNNPSYGSIKLLGVTPYDH